MWSVAMNDNEKIAENDKVACNVCLKEIPSSEAKSAEAADYVAHFCGLDCYDEWLKKQDESESN